MARATARAGLSRAARAVAALMLVAAAARARGAPPADGPAAQQLAAAAGELARAREVERALGAEVARARGGHDLPRLACLEDRLPEVSRLTRFAERSAEDVKALLARGEPGVDVALTALTRARVRAERSAAEADGCPRRAAPPLEGAAGAPRAREARGAGR